MRWIISALWKYLRHQIHSWNFPPNILVHSQLFHSSIFFIANLLLILCVLHIMHPDVIRLPSPSYPPSALANLLQKKRKFKKKTIFIVEALVWQSKAHSIPLSPYTCKCSLLASVHCNEFWFLRHYCYWVLIETPFRYLVTLSHGDPETLGLKDGFLHMLQNSIDGMDVRVGQLITLVLGLHGSCVGQPADSPSSPPGGPVLQHCPG